MVVVSDIRMPGMDGIALLAKLKSQQPDLPVIITTAHSDLDSAVSSYEEGAFEYLPKPFDIEEMVATVTRAQSQRTQHDQVDEDQGSNPSAEIIGNAPAMQEVFRAIGRLAQSHITVLINGESGTGKELVARALHRHSPRADNAFVALNMAAIPQELMESELFGHEKGAFTGANSRREGASNRPAAARCFSMKSATCPLLPRPGYCACFRTVSSSASAVSTRSRQMCGSSLQPTKSSSHWWRPVLSGRTCSIDST
jgi:DNA-binding NtrC family response regulator